MGHAGYRLVKVFHLNYHVEGSMLCQSLMTKKEAVGDVFQITMQGAANLSLTQSN